MKKTQVALSLAGVMAAATFAPQASALPLFARQVGMACNACHFQHFPMLNGFGRSFKAAGYTLMGAESKVEGDNMSIPGVLNAAILTTFGYTKTNQSAAYTAAGASSITVGGLPAGIPTARALAGVRTPADGSVYVPGTNGEFSLFVGGRTSENSGALAEVGLLHTGGAGAGVASAKLPFLFPVGDSGMRAGVVPFTTDGQGASYGFEILNTGANAVHTMVFDGGDFNGSIGTTVSAQQYILTATPATGAAVVVDGIQAGPATMFVNLTKFHQVGPADLGGNGASLGSSYLRVAGTFDMAGWDTGVGIQRWDGKSASLAFAAAGTITAASLVQTKATAVDFQMQGEVAGMPVGIYAEYANAPAPDSGQTNAYNPNATAGGTARKAFVVSTEWGVVPEKVTVGAAIRRGSAGTALGTASQSDNSYMIEGSYKIAQNILVNLYYTHQSGDIWTTAVANQFGSNQTTLNVATIF
jgi:hypothetical protein